MIGRRKAQNRDSDDDPMKFAWSTKDSTISLRRADEVLTPSYVFTLTDSEVERKLFQLRYHTRNDAYYRLGSDAAAIQGWQNGSYAAVNVVRQDQDGLAYLTRAAGHSQASISWKVDLRDSGLVVDTIQALTLSRTLSGGIITYDIVSPDGNQQADLAGYVPNGWQTLYLVAYLSGSRTPDSYDQTQLLYQSSAEDQDIFPLDILLTLKPFQEILCTCPQVSAPSHEVKTQEPAAAAAATTTTAAAIVEPPLEQCTCYFPNAASGSLRRTDWPAKVPPPGTERMATAETKSALEGDDLSIVSRHAISLPGTPVHRRHYGSRAGPSTAGSASSSSGRRLGKGNKVQSLPPPAAPRPASPSPSACLEHRGYDNCGAELSAGTPTAEGATFQVLAVSELEAMGSGQSGDAAQRVWSQVKQVDSQTLVVEDEPDTSRRICKGSVCTIS